MFDLNNFYTFCHSQNRFRFVSSRPFYPYSLLMVKWILKKFCDLKVTPSKLSTTKNTKLASHTQNTKATPNHLIIVKTTTNADVNNSIPCQPITTNDRSIKRQQPEQHFLIVDFVLVPLAIESTQTTQILQQAPSAQHLTPNTVDPSLTIYNNNCKLKRE